MAPGKNTEKEKERKNTCVGCKKKFVKADYCTICGSCNYWYHKTCAGLTDDMFKCIEQYYKDHDATFWNCQPCATYAKGITARMREMEGRLTEVEKQQEQQGARMEKTEKRTEKVEKEIKRMDGRIEAAKEDMEKVILGEMRERELRKLNVVFYGIGEKEGVNTTLEERKDWDIKSCTNIFNTLNLRMDREVIRFCRRLGERGERPRPMVVGLRSEEEKTKLLHSAKNLRNTHYSDVGVSADLTKKQLQEEKDLEAEAAARNEERTQDDKSKNLKWMVVGKKGEKRLIKGVERTAPAWQGNQRGMGDRRRNGGERRHSKRNLSGTDSDTESGEAATRSRKRQMIGGRSMLAARGGTQKTGPGGMRVEATESAVTMEREDEESESAGEEMEETDQPTEGEVEEERL